MVDDFDLLLMSKYDVFFRRIVEYTLNIIEGGKEETLLILVDEERVRYEMNLPKPNFKKSLEKAKKYFEKIEEYETCDLILQIIKEL
jgi:hypothetical protein